MRHVCARNRPRSSATVAASAEQMLEHRAAGLRRMDALPHLRQLLRIAEQHEVARGSAHRDRVGQRHLARFVDEQVVEPADPCPRARTATRCRRRARRLPASHASLLVGVLVDEPAAECVVVAAHFLRPDERDCLRDRERSTSCSRLLMALWLFAVTPTRLPGAMQRHDQPRAGPGLARAGRTLDEQVAAIERRRRAPVCVAQVERLERRPR